MNINEIKDIANQNPETLRNFLIETIQNCSCDFLVEFFKADLGLDSDLQEFIDLKEEKNI